MKTLTLTFTVASRAVALCIGGSIMLTVAARADLKWEQSTVEVHPAGESKSCTVKWNGSTHTFHDPCSGHDYPADGTGLVRYQTTVQKNGDLVVDLHQPIS